MKPAVTLLTSVLALAMTSACSPHATPRTVSDLCLNDREVKFSVAPSSGVDDPGNKFDTEETVADLLAHNAVLRRLCANR
jgi:hypothetical protein